jgi:hypothetical protein
VRGGKNVKKGEVLVGVVVVGREVRDGALREQRDREDEWISAEDAHGFVVETGVAMDAGWVVIVWS